MSVPISCPPNIKDRVAIVTGAGGGIGKAISFALNREGAKVIASDIKACNFYKRHSDHMSFFQCDITQENQVESLVEFALDKYKRIDILVNSAGVVGKTPITPITELSESEWDWVLDVNLKGTFFCCKHVMKLMQEQKYGKIICIGSIAGKVGGLITGSHYVASKAAVHGLTKSLARNGAIYGVLANCIVPGQIRTPMLDKLDLSSLDIPVGRLGEPEDISELVVFLASDAANFINGALINVNGGIFMDG